MFASYQLPAQSETCHHCFQQRSSRSSSRQQQRLRRASTSARPCFASSAKRPAPSIDTPERFPHNSSAEVRKHLEQLYQLDLPARPLWYSSSLVQEIAKYGLLGMTSTLPVQLCEPPPDTSKLKDADSKRKKDNFYANVGDAIRTLREETPFLFQRDLTYDIYRDDIVFRDTRNVFQGKKNYKTIWWSLRFHGALFFSRLRVDVKRIWQPEESIIRLRWTVHGIPRVPWEAEGVFDGISEYKLDSEGKIYEHKVTNVQMRDPPFARSPWSIGLNLAQIPRLQGAPQAPCPGAFCRGDEQGTAATGFGAYLARFSWVRMYAALLGTVQLLQKQQHKTVLDM